MGKESTAAGSGRRGLAPLLFISGCVLILALGASPGHSSVTAGIAAGGPVPAAVPRPAGAVPASAGALPPPAGAVPPQEVVDVDLGAVYWYDEYKNTLTLQNNCNKTERVQIELPWGGTADNNLPGMWLWLDDSPMGFRVWHDLPPKSSKSLDVAVRPLGAISRTYQRNPGVTFVDTRPSFPESLNVNGQIIVTYTGSSLCKPKTKTFNFHAVFRERPGDAPDDEPNDR